MRIEYGAARRVLLVEDNPAEQEVVRAHLASARFDVEIAPDYQSALRALETNRPDLVCVDLTLPRESGYELCEFMRGAGKLSFEHVPIVVMSDRGSPEEMAHAEDVGATAFIKKPFTRDRLLKYVFVLLDGPHSSRPSVRRLRRSDPP